MFLRRLLYKYVVYDASPVALYAVLGMLLGGFGTVFGAYHWWQSISLDIAQSPHPRDPREKLDVSEVQRRFGG